MDKAKRIRVRHTAIWVVLVLFIGSCNDHTPVAPGPGKQPPPPATVTTVRVEIFAPTEIAPDETVQLGLNAVKSDGSVEDVTSKASWSPTSSPILQISTTGMATAKAPGSTFVSASYLNRGTSKLVIVVPRGTFRLTGTVKESGFGIGDVTISVVSGMGEGLRTVTASNGAYVIHGVGGVVKLQLKKDGYLNGLPQLDVTEHRSADFEIVADGARRNYSGNYQLNISAAPGCATGSRPLLESARRRTYSATATQEGARLTVTLGDADLVVTNGYGNRFVGYVEPNDLVTFPIGDWYYYYYYSGHFDIVERLSNTSVVMIGGIATARGTSTSLSGTLTGTITVGGKTTYPFFPFTSQCGSNAHQFEMLRR